MKKFILLCTLSFFVIFSFHSPKVDAVEGSLIIINKTTNQLAYFENGVFIRSFSVATGKQASYTPEGTFTIVNKIKNRPYYSGNIAGGDPNNPLGNRWLGLNARGTNGDTYAIHGNNNPNSIGKYVSNGCIRMYDEEIEWLFNRVPVHTTVHITSSSKSFQDIAASLDYKTQQVQAQSVSGLLKIGSQGVAVRELQQQLTNNGYSTGGIDGIFGTQTKQAVIQFQRNNGLTADGIVGPMTNKALNKY
ncbi:L,D-transpeptidase family protein [Metabacillus malikii]|uniref:L,D-TPase catalytic domain-containing protein n=1 Tax=Metabacillus malikii TaxID=1504265 RepID=A0ABT9ZKQ2_9BACI|nr:L,D-transpeptidase family protein [Metabacillus malikii]MDQ0232560.1 hypothetical protein [Metabacillus malikii]